jgi:hypothetical protein
LVKIWGKVGDGTQNTSEKLPGESPTRPITPRTVPE